jgi:RimJ/RimL family protein N-acetyltransferase
LRPLREGDAPAVFAGFNDWEVVRSLSSPPWPNTLADAESAVRRSLDATTNPDEELRFAITRKDALIGIIGVRHRAAGEHQRADGYNIGYWLGRDHWGQGLMTEAARGLIAHTFALTRADAIYSGAFAENTASLNVQRKIGFLPYSETILYSRPRDAMLPHVNTALAREAFEKIAA